MNEQAIIQDLKHYARVKTREAKLKRKHKIDKLVKARVRRIVEARAQDIASQLESDDKPVTTSWHERWKQKKFSWF